MMRLHRKLQGQPLNSLGRVDKLGVALIWPDFRRGHGATVSSNGSRCASLYRHMPVCHCRILILSTRPRQQHGCSSRNKSRCDQGTVPKACCTCKSTKEPHGVSNFCTSAKTDAVPLPQLKTTFCFQRSFFLPQNNQR